MSPNETNAPSGLPHRRRRALSSGVTIVLGSLLVGGVTTYAAATTSANSQIVSLGGSPVERAGPRAGLIRHGTDHDVDDSRSGRADC